MIPEGRMQLGGPEAERSGFLARVCIRAGGLALGLILPCVVGAQDFPYRFFPLEEGNVWRYWWGGDEEAYQGWLEFQFGCELRVIRREGDRVVLRKQYMRFDTGDVTFEPAYLRLVDRGNEIDVELPEEGDVSYYRFEEDEFLHRDPLDSCADGLTEVRSRDDVVETRIGTFTSCVRLFFTKSRFCADGGLVNEWWYPEVGLVKWFDKAELVQSLYLLEFERHLPRFVRGDVQGDGIIDLSDPVALLGYLFLGSQEPPCLDAADADDQGALELSDAVYLLQWLFWDGSGPPQPAPSAGGTYSLADCGVDGTTMDALDCSASRCEESP